MPAADKCAPGAQPAVIVVIAVMAMIAMGGAALFASSVGRADASASSSSSSSPLPLQRWQTLQDPHEQAFSIAVPGGWKTYGGLFRFSAVDTRMVIDMTSPEGSSNVRIGDVTVPPYTVPGAFIRRGPHMASYASGAVFAARYGQARFGSLCDDLHLTRSQGLAPKYHPIGGGLIRTTAGEAFFSCTRKGAATIAYVYAETTLVGRGEPGSNWSVTALGSLIAPADQATGTAAILQHSAESLVMNPVWMQMQSRSTALAIRQLDAATQATITATNAENARERGMISSLQNDSFNDVINGVSLKVDPSTGQRYETPLGNGNPQWINGSNTVLESAMSPGPGFTRLQSVSR